MRTADYNNNMYKQIQDLLNKCDSLSQEIKNDRKEFKKEKIELNKKISNLETKVHRLETENKKLRDDNDRLKKQINNNSDNSSKPPSSDIKKNIPNNREKTGRKVGAQKGHTAHFLDKKDIENKIKAKEFKHEVINVGNPQGEYKSKYILDIKVDVIAKEYRFFKDTKGKYNIPKEFQTDVQYGNELKTICSTLNLEGVVAIDRLTKLVGCISHGKMNISNGTLVNFVTELKKKSECIVENIKEKLLNSNLLYTDATSVRCENKNISVRNYSTEKYTYLVPTYGKGKEHIEDTNILNRYTGNLVHDHETVIYNYGNKHVECNVHISRYLKGCYENTQHKWALNLRSLLCSLNEYKKKLIKRNIKKLTQEQLLRYSKRYDEILEDGYLENKKLKSKYLKQEEQKLLNRLKKYKENHLMFLYDFDMPFDNNLSERDLRHVKTKQKVSGYFNNLESSKTYFNIKSIISTLKKQNRNYYKEIFNIYENIPISI